MEILRSIARSRFLTSGQIRRTHFADKPGQAAAIRSSNRALARLGDMQLIDHLERRVGGMRAGSSSHVWSLAPAGARLLESTGQFDGLPRRVREYEPTLTFLEHTLAVAEVCLTLSEAAHSGKFAILELQREPDCWRAYNGSHGGIVHLKPDLAVVTASGAFEDHWFVEVDLDTEPPSRVVRTCLRYEAYRRSGAEQRRLGLFPAVVWIVPNEQRKASLARHLAAEPRLSRGMYAVVVLDELASLMKSGMETPETGHES